MSINKLQNPAPLLRPAPFWSWNDKLDEAELRRQIREMAAKGWGSYFMHSRVGLVTRYLSDEWMALVSACADEAEKTGTYAWLYDEDKWPSGFAGGAVPEADDAYRSRALVLLKKGELTENETLLEEITYGGTDYEICLRVDPLGNLWFNGACYVDLMNPEAVRHFLNCTHERYKAACGEHFGRAIPGIFTDEPCYLWPKSMQAPAVPWSDYLPDFFQKMKGYDIRRHLPSLFFETSNYRKIRFDFYDAATELFKESFTRQYYEWCRKNNLIMTGHFMCEDTLWAQTLWSGDVMSHYEYMTWPGIDKLGRHLEQVVTVKQVSSVVDQLEKERAFSEVFGCMGGQCSFFHRKWIGDWQAALGISFVNHHLSLYSMRGERKRDYPANLFYQQPWWEDEREFADYQGRLCAFASEGERLTDILVLQPLASVWSEYSPLHTTNQFAVEEIYDRPFAAISHRLLEQKLDFHYGNENLMMTYGAVKNDLLYVGACFYTCVLVPPSLNIKEQTLALLQCYSAAGGKLIFCGTPPMLVDGEEAEIDFPGAIVAATLEEAVSLVSGLFPHRIKATDKLTGDNAPSVYIHSRRVGNTLRHLLVNTDEKREIQAQIEVPGCSQSALAAFDLCTGDLYRLSADNDTIDVTLYPAASLLLISGEEAEEADKDVPAFLGSGAAFFDPDHKLPQPVIEDFDCELLEENVLLLNDFTLEMNGRKVYEGPVCGAWHKYFYAAPDGTPFKATYECCSESAIDGCFAVIEMAENLETIIFNGRPVHPLKAPGQAGAFDPQQSWKDVNFTRVPLPPLQEGINTLIIEGKKVNNITGPACHNRVEDWQEHQPTEAEEVYLCGRFSLKRVSGGRYVIIPFKQPFGRNLTEEGFPFYSGRMRLQTTFTMEKEAQKRVFLQLDDVSAACVRVRVNGQECGTLRWEPFILDISAAVKLGDNTLEIEAVTTLVNALGPNRRAGIKEEAYVGPHSFIAMARFKGGYELFDFGIGSAKIMGSGVYI
ncbi:MAG: glycoside hydrolase [bacterium]|jgi:hypothetical protein